MSAIEMTGSFDIGAGLDFSCLPPPWPEQALETVNPTAAANTHVLPVHLVVQDVTLHIDKKQAWMSRRPFPRPRSYARLVYDDLPQPHASPSDARLLFALWLIVRGFRRPGVS